MASCRGDFLDEACGAIRTTGGDDAVMFEMSLEDRDVPTMTSTMRSPGAAVRSAVFELSVEQEQAQRVLEERLEARLDEGQKELRGLIRRAVQREQEERVAQHESLVELHAGLQKALDDLETRMVPVSESDVGAGPDHQLLSSPQSYSGPLDMRQRMRVLEARSSTGGATAPPLWPSRPLPSVGGHTLETLEAQCRDDMDRLSGRLDDSVVALEAAFVQVKMDLAQDLAKSRSANSYAQDLEDRTKKLCNLVVGHKSSIEKQIADVKDELAAVKSELGAIKNGEKNGELHASILDLGRQLSEVQLSMGKRSQSQECDAGHAEPQQANHDASAQFLAPQNHPAILHAASSSCSILDSGRLIAPQHSALRMSTSSARQFSPSALAPAGSGEAVSARRFPHEALSSLPRARSPEEAALARSEAVRALSPVAVQQSSPVGAAQAGVDVQHARRQSSSAAAQLSPRPGLACSGGGSVDVPGGAFVVSPGSMRVRANVAAAAATSLARGRDRRPHSAASTPRPGGCREAPGAATPNVRLRPANVAVSQLTPRAGSEDQGRESRPWQLSRA